jgi:hypothetical protein
MTLTDYIDCIYIFENPVCDVFGKQYVVVNKEKMHYFVKTSWICYHAMPFFR